MHAGGGLFADAFPIFHNGGEPAGPVFSTTLEEVFDDVLFVAAARTIHPVAPMLHFIALMKQQRGVAAIIYDKLRTFVSRMRQGGQGVILVFFELFAFECE